MSETAVAYQANGAALADRGESLPGILGDDGYTLPPGLPFDRWVGIMSTLQQIDRSVKWWLGDALIYGERTYGEQAADAYPDAFSKKIVSESAMRQAMWVSEKFPPDTRVSALSWTHHRAVAELPPADRSELLQTAERERLSTRDLIDRVRDRQEAIKGHVNGARSEPVCAADAPWVPTVADLSDEWRPHVEAEARGSPDFIRGVIWAWRMAGNEACFKEWRD
jgi:hypothetical protein